MQVFVTGGSGFIGGHLIEALARHGHDVRALARSDKAAEQVRAYGAAPVRGELGSVTPALLASAEAVVHAAAFVEEWGTREQFWQGNVVGTRNMLEAARAAGVRRFIHVGTEAALFAGQDLVDVDESAPYRRTTATSTPRPRRRPNAWSCRRMRRSSRPCRSARASCGARATTASSRAF